MLTPDVTIAARSTMAACAYDCAQPGIAVGMPSTPAVHHVAMSVRDLGVSEPFYVKLFGAEPAMTLSDGPFRRRVFALAGGQLFGLTQHETVSSDDRFDPARVGLDHVGFGCADADAVAAWPTTSTRRGSSTPGSSRPTTGSRSR